MRNLKESYRLIRKNKKKQPCIRQFSWCYIYLPITPSSDQELKLCLSAPRLSRLSGSPDLEPLALG